MKKSQYTRIKNEDVKFSVVHSKSELNEKKTFDELDTKVIPYYSHLQITPNKQKFQINPQLTAKLYIGDKRFSKALFEDKLMIQRVKKHLDQEYLEKYRNKYVFNPSPPRPDLHNDSQHQPLKMTINLAPLNHKNAKNSKKKNNNNTTNKSSSQQNTIISNKGKEDHQKNSPNLKQTNKTDCNDDDLPIALRRTKRPKTKPLRFWLGEKIIYKIDEETGCYTKAFEVKVNQNRDSAKKQEIIVEKKSKKIVNAQNKMKMVFVESGQLLIIINNKQYKASAGCKLYLQKGQDITFVNQSNDDSIISMI